MTQADSVHSTPPINTPVSQIRPVDDPTRRRFLSTTASVVASGAVLPLATIPPAAAAVAPAGSPDPIFAMLTMHKKLQAEWGRLNDQLDEAEFGDAAEGRGRRPTQLICWRGYTIGDSEIDIRRETLLEARQIDPATVEQEYLDAKARYQAQVAAGVAWDERHGLSPLRNDLERGIAAEQRYAERLAHAKPTTPAGVAALIQYILDDDLQADENYWHMIALRNAAAALNSMGAAVQS